MSASGSPPGSPPTGTPTTLNFAVDIRMLTKEQAALLDPAVGKDKVAMVVTFGISGERRDSRAFEPSVSIRKLLANGLNASYEAVFKRARKNLSVHRKKDELIILVPKDLTTKEFTDYFSTDTNAVIDNFLRDKNKYKKSEESPVFEFWDANGLPMDAGTDTLGELYSRKASVEPVVPVRKSGSLRSSATRPFLVSGISTRWLEKATEPVVSPGSRITTPSTPTSVASRERRPSKQAADYVPTLQHVLELFSEPAAGYTNTLGKLIQAPPTNAARQILYFPSTSANLAALDTACTPNEDAARLLGRSANSFNGPMLRAAIREEEMRTKAAKSIEKLIVSRDPLLRLFGSPRWEKLFLSEDLQRFFKEYRDACKHRFYTSVDFNETDAIAVERQNTYKNSVRDFLLYDAPFASAEYNNLSHALDALKGDRFLRFFYARLLRTVGHFNRTSEDIKNEILIKRAESGQSISGLVGDPLFLLYDSLPRSVKLSELNEGNAADFLKRYMIAAADRYCDDGCLVFQSLSPCVCVCPALQNLIAYALRVKNGRQDADRKEISLCKEILRKVGIPQDYVLSQAMQIPPPPRLPAELKRATGGGRTLPVEVQPMHLSATFPSSSKLTHQWIGDDIVKKINAQQPNDLGLKIKYKFGRWPFSVMKTGLVICNQRGEEIGTIQHSPYVMTKGESFNLDLTKVQHEQKSLYIGFFVSMMKQLRQDNAKFATINWQLISPDAVALRAMENVLTDQVRTNKLRGEVVAKSPSQMSLGSDTHLSHT